MPLPKPHLPGNILRTKDRRPTRTAYALPTLFTAGNILLGYLAIVNAIKGALLVQAGQAGHVQEWENAAKMIGIAVALDGLDGRIARMTGTVSDFGREIDSLADVVTFGIAPAVLAVVWGVLFVNPLPEELGRAGYFFAFIFLLCGALRLARFNVTLNPVPKNPVNPDRKYFVGLPIPAAAGFVSAIIYAYDAVPLRNWVFSSVWVGLVAALGLLMVSMWRYRSFKDLDLLRPRTPLMFLATATTLFLVWNYSKPALLTLAVAYVSSGILVRIGGLMRRYLRRSPRPQEPSAS